MSDSITSKERNVVEIVRRGDRWILESVGADGIRWPVVSSPIPFEVRSSPEPQPAASNEPVLADYIARWSTVNVVAHEQERSAREDHSTAWKAWARAEIERLQRELADAEAIIKRERATHAANMDRATAEPEADCLLGELLAVVHGDGGHYRAEHGNRKATEDAIAILSARAAERVSQPPLATSLCSRTALDAFLVKYWPDLELRERSALPPCGADEAVKWIEYLEAEPHSEPYLTIAAVMRSLRQRASQPSGVARWRCVSYCLCTPSTTKGHFVRDDEHGVWVKYADIRGATTKPTDDAPQFFRNESGDIDFGPAASPTKCEGPRLEDIVDSENWCPQCAHPRGACVCGQEKGSAT